MVKRVCLLGAQPIDARATGHPCQRYLRPENLPRTICSTQLCKRLQSDAGSEIDNGNRGYRGEHGGCHVWQKSGCNVQQLNAMAWRG